MTDRSTADSEATYPVRTVSRITGVSPDCLRAWERRYGLVVPARTPGGTRRYRAADLVRLRLLKAAIDGGSRIGDLAGLGLADLERLAARQAAPEPTPIEATLAALGRLDAAEAEQLASLQLAALGPVRFAREFALPLLEAAGSAWASAHLCIASEHLGTALIRSLLGGALRPTLASRSGPRLLFATPPGERHEIGLLAAAVVALGAGGDVLYLGPEVPIEEIVAASVATGASAVALGLVALAPEAAAGAARGVRAGLADGVELWLGGARAGGLALRRGVYYLDSLAAIERRVALLGPSRAAGAGV